MTGNSLTRLRTSGSTGRVLNLSAVFETYGDTDEYAEAPMFINSKLNKAVLLKHTLRAYERDLVNDERLTVTKVILPFDPRELGLGGYSFFISEYGFDRNIAARIGATQGSADLRRDLQVLRMLDALPAFDPFLLRERLKRASLRVSRCYFDLSEADAARMKGYLQDEIGKIVQLAFAKDADLWTLSASMTEKLLTDETAESLEPLRLTLGLAGEEYRDGIFAWKGFLYYSWNIGRMLDFVPNLQRHIVGMKFLRATPEENKELTNIRRRILRCIDFLVKRVRSGVDGYKDAYQSLVDGKPGPFRRFLKEAPKRFLEVGDAFGMLMHIKMYWDFRFPHRRNDWIDVEEATEIFRDFNLHISGIAVLTGEPAEQALKGSGRIPAAGSGHVNFELGL